MRFGATPRLLDSFRGKLSYFLHLRIGLGFVDDPAKEYGGWDAAKYEEDQKTVRGIVFPTIGMWAMVVIEGHPEGDACVGPAPYACASP